MIAELSGYVNHFLQRLFILQGTVLAEPHPCGDDELEVYLILGALILQHGGQQVRGVVELRIFLVLL